MADPSSPATEPDREKAPAAGSAFTDIPLPALLFVPCGVESKPVGTRVHRGGSLAREGNTSPAPADGEIVGVAASSALGSTEAPAIAFKPDPGQIVDIPPMTTRELVRAGLEALHEGDPSAAMNRLEAAGVRADRWTSPDLLAQLRAVAAKGPADAVVCGALDLDPVLPVQWTLLSTSALEVAAGTAALARAVGAKRSMLVVPEDLPTAVIRSLRIAAEATGVILFPVPNEYPLGNASLLILRVLGRRLKPGTLPTEVNAMLLDAPAAVATARCFIHTEPQSHVPLGVYDRRSAHPHLLRVAVGTTLRDVLAFCEIPLEGVEVRAGHTLRELPVKPEAIVANGELSVFVDERVPPAMAAACLRCGWCVEACPVEIHPAGLLEAAQQHDIYLADRNGLKSCIDCGICSHVCPSRLPLLAAIRSLKT